MRKSTFLVVIFLCCSLGAYAQESEPPLEDLFSANINLVGLGISYERAVGNDFTTFFEANYQLAGLFKGSGDNDIDYAFAGNFILGGRYYYNRTRRFEKNKKLDDNAGNYLSLRGNIVPAFTLLSNDESTTLQTTYGLGALYGLRRNITTNLNYEFEFGVSINGSKSELELFPLLQFKLQYVLF